MKKMKIINKTKDKVLSSNAEVAGSLLQKGLGLIGQDRSKSLILHTRWGIHSFGLKNTIDILVLGGKDEVVIKKELKPWRILIWNPVYKTVVELPRGAGKGNEMGDILVFR
jgi:uncharacterized membrane protein (UPF0127 family)